MSNLFTHNSMVDFVQGSPNAVAKHDKTAWLFLFAQEGIVEDPVGSTPNRSRIDPKSQLVDNSALSKFFDTFIAPNDIVFNVAHDFSAANAVARDLAINLNMAPGVTAAIPMHLRYELVDEAGQLKIQHLYAHWELLPMIVQVMKMGLPGLLTTLRLSATMLRHQGLGGLLGFARGFVGIHAKGKKCAQQFIDALNQKNLPALRALLHNNDTRVEYPFGQFSIPAEQFIHHWHEAHAYKWIAAGHIVSCSFTQAAEIDSAEKHGVIFFEFNPNTQKIARVIFFFD